MCLAVPARILSIDEIHAWVDTLGVRQKINIQLIDCAVPDDYVLVHAGLLLKK